MSITDTEYQELEREVVYLRERVHRLSWELGEISAIRREDLHAGDAALRAGRFITRIAVHCKRVTLALRESEDELAAAARWHATQALIALDFLARDREQS